MWQTENIPDDGALFYRLHATVDFRDGIVKPRAFQERGEGDARGMSTDWDKYSTPKKSRDRVREFGKDPANYRIGKFMVGVLRNELLLSVTHQPFDENRAHTSVTGIDGERETELRLKLRDVVVLVG